MKKVQPVALIGAGKFSDSPVRRLLRRSAQLGPVLWPSFRIASRMANSLRAGYAVREYTEIESCRLILLSLPDKLIASVVSELASAPLCWYGKTVLLCSSWLDSSELEPLAALGASIGSLSLIPGFEDPCYLLEGDRLAIREMRRLRRENRVRLVTVERERKQLVLASQSCTGRLACALLLAASESLRHAGLSSAESSSIMEKQLQRTLRIYLRARRKAIPETRHLSRQLRALELSDPRLAHYLKESSRLAATLAAGLKSIPEARCHTA